MKKLLSCLFLLSCIVAKSQTYFTITAGPQYLSSQSIIQVNPVAGQPVRPKNGIALNFEPEWRKGNHFTFGLMFSHAQFGFEQYKNSSATQAMLNFKFPITIKFIQPYVGFGVGYLNQSINGLEEYTRDGQMYRTIVSNHYAGVSPYAGLTVFLSQKVRLTANYRHAVALYSKQGFAANPVSSGFNIGFNILIQAKFQRDI